MEVREPSAKCPANAGYRHTEVGVIPDDWRVATLREISPKQSVGLVINPSSYFEKNGSVPMLVGSNISPNRINWESANRITEESNKQIAASRLSVGDLVTVRVGEPGITAVIPPDLDGCNCASVMIVRRGPTFDSHWLCYTMNSPMGISQIENVQYGTAQKQFNIGDAVNFVYPFPPLHEQQAIAEALSDADALIESLEHLLAKKRQIKQGAMQELLTGQKRLPGFAGDWDSVSLGDLFQFKNGLNKAKEFFGHGTPIVNYMDVFSASTILCRDIEGRVSLTNQELKNFDVRKGDVLFTRTSETALEVGMAAVIADEPSNTVFSGFVLRGRPKNDRLCNEFKAYCLRASYVRAQIVSKASYTTRALTNGRLLSAVILRVPGVKEQTAIATVLSDVDVEIAALEAKLAKARGLKLGMMQELLTGRIRLV